VIGISNVRLIYGEGRTGSQAPVRAEGDKSTDTQIMPSSLSEKSSSPNKEDFDVNLGHEKKIQNR